MDAKFRNHMSSSPDGVAAVLAAGYSSPAYKSVAALDHVLSEQEHMPPLPGRNGVSARELNSIPQFFADTIFIVGLTLAVGLLCRPLGFEASVPLANFSKLGLALAVLFGAISRISRQRLDVRPISVSDRAKQAMKCWWVAITLFVFFLVAFKASFGASQSTLVVLGLVGAPVLAFWHALLPQRMSRLMARARSGRQCIIIADADDPWARELSTELQDAGQSAPKIITGRTSCSPADWANELRRILDHVTDVAGDLGPGDIYISAGRIGSERLAALSRGLALIPRALLIFPQPHQASLVQYQSVVVGQKLAVEVRREPLGAVQRAVKRSLDIVISAAALAFLLPLFVVIGILIAMDSRGPVFFRQTRNGYQGKPFRIWKFRSMRVHEDGPEVKQAVRGDPRVTKVGAVLRKTSLDELPQLINILTGDMSLVGPRPHAQAHDELYSKLIKHYDIRQHVKPGLTGWAQVNGLRGETSNIDLMRRRVEYDIWYATNASVILDLEILVKTFVAIWFHKNAY
ncbi:Undecaprenyl-phosphate glucose phosphotransferase [Rhizomicrobium palustre]|uniref:Undecaprenyl-phosphate glucose phosphotransferase n=1 Tax=Rhizomicrobium palustre TaxID=189966 RepID=A0A846MZG9_9PROT|nr:exopolysaccharide biosynthesis polyprenyl glycosylphosphotransferase [Rhizomicrobium palustre]NIK88350.1 Undecaprenyl-phosphate glucose phosphotransferase [Rhizomicrobium palustre]